MLNTVISILIGVVSVLLVAVVLLQPSKTDSFQGEAPSTGENRFGRNTGPEAFLKKSTIVLGIAFIALTLLLAVLG